MVRKLVLVIAFASVFAGCEACSLKLKHLESSTVGIHRKVTLYNANGVPIKTWCGKFAIESDNAAGIGWLAADGRSIRISGTFLVEELTDGESC